MKTTNEKVRIVLGAVFYALGALALVFIVPTVRASNSPVVPSCAVGFWRLTADDDNLGISDVMEFRSDGIWRNYTPQCKVSSGKFFMAGSDIVVLVEGRKGPTSMVFRPQANRLNIIFTSVRTGNNSTYSRVENPAPCVPQ